MFSCSEIQLSVLSSRVFISHCVASIYRDVIHFLIMYISAIGNMRPQDEYSSIAQTIFVLYIVVDL